VSSDKLNIYVNDGTIISTESRTLAGILSRPVDLFTLRFINARAMISSYVN
jgi:hypothetical protein